MPIPLEIQQKFDDVRNNLELELAVDIIANLEKLEEEYNIPDINVEKAWGTIVEKIGDLGNTFSECDP